MSQVQISIHFFIFFFLLCLSAFGHLSSACSECDEVASAWFTSPSWSPSCGLNADESGRFHFGFSTRCSAARVVEASICAARVFASGDLGKAFLFYDVALKYVASYGGTWCFDNSDWSNMFNVSSEELLWLQAQVLVDMGEPSGEILQSHIKGLKDERLACSLPQVPHPRDEDEERLAAIAEAQVMEWNQEVLNINSPYWKGIGENGLHIPQVGCLVPIVWPRQQEFLQAIVDTFGADCDELLFFISSDSMSQGELDRIKASTRRTHNMSIINLHVWYPVVPPDRDEFHRETGDRPRHDTFNTIIKLLHMMRWTAEHRMDQSKEQWWCRLERDTFFIPENFRLLVVSERMDASHAHYLGVRQFLDLPRTGFVFNDGGPGVCLSQRALSDLHEVLVATPNQLVDHPDFQRCVLAKGHREDLMLAACLRQINILPSAATSDRFGREWFSIRPLTAVSAHHPLSGSDQQAWNFWTGRSHLFLPCANGLNQWIVESPVSFNSFKNTSMFYEAWSFLNLKPSERWKRIGFVLQLSGLRREEMCRCRFT